MTQALTYVRAKRSNKHKHEVIYVGIQCKYKCNTGYSRLDIFLWIFNRVKKDNKKIFLENILLRGLISSQTIQIAEQIAKIYADI